MHLQLVMDIMLSMCDCSTKNKWMDVTWFAVMTLAPSFEHLLMVPVLFSPIIDPRDDASICAGDHYPPLLSSIRHRQAFPRSDHSSMQRKVCPGETNRAHYPNGSDLPLPVAVPAVLFWRALLLTQLMDDLAISLFHLMVICFRQIFLNYTYRLVFHW